LNKTSFRRVAFVPLFGPERIEGWLALGPKQSGEPFSSDDISFVTALANETALALGKARTFSDLSRRVKELSALALVSQAGNFTLPLDDIFELIYTQASRILEAHNFFVVLFDASSATAFLLLRGRRRALFRRRVAARHWVKCGYPRCSPSAPTTI
jgi:hypothetical protein